jgi:hypothetical protein
MYTLPPGGLCFRLFNVKDILCEHIKVYKLIQKDNEVFMSLENFGVCMTPYKNIKQ